MGWLITTWLTVMAFIAFIGLAEVLLKAYLQEGEPPATQDIVLTTETKAVFNPDTYTIGQWRNNGRTKKPELVLEGDLKKALEALYTAGYTYGRTTLFGAVVHSGEQRRDKLIFDLIRALVKTGAVKREPKPRQLKGSISTGPK